MEFETIDSARGELPGDLPTHFQGDVRLQRFTSPFGERPAVFAVHFEAGARTPARCSGLCCSTWGLSSGRGCS